MDALEVLRGRRSVRAYDGQRPVTQKQIETIVDCGRLASTARNVQPWEFIVVTDSAVRASLAALATNGPFISDAPVCIAVICQEGTYYLEDGCNATENLLLAAHALGLGAVWLGYHPNEDRKDALRAILGLPPTVEPFGIAAIGHPDESKPPVDRFDTAHVHREVWS